MRGIVVVVVTALLIAGAVLQAEAQRQPSAAPQVDLGQPGQSAGNVQNPYFRPTERPFQGSFSRRWQRELQETWGRTPARRGVPPGAGGPGFAPPAEGPIFVYPPSHCYGRTCHRRFHRQPPRWGFGWGWNGWQTQVR
jgi:hypothetical protein